MLDAPAAEGVQEPEGGGGLKQATAMTLTTGDNAQVGSSPLRLEHLHKCGHLCARMLSNVTQFEAPRMTPIANFVSLPAALSPRVRYASEL